MSVGAPPVGTPPNMATPGSLTALIDGLVALQATVPAHPLLAGFQDTLTCVPFRPDQADPPVLYNWILPSSSEMKDLSRVRDVINVSTRIGIRFTDVADRMAFVLAAADAYRAIVDPSFWDGQRVPPATAGYATWLMRTTMQSFSETIGSTPLVGIEFISTAWLDRHV
jgi:hypothetical protein